MAIRNIVLTGPRGVGKTTILHLVAGRLGLKPFRFDDILLKHFAPNVEVDEFLQTGSASRILNHEAPKLLRCILSDHSGIILELGSGAVTAFEHKSTKENQATIRQFSQPIVLLLYPSLIKSVSVLYQRLLCRRSRIDTEKTITVSYLRCLNLPLQLGCMSLFALDFSPLQIGEALAHAIANSRHHI